MGLWGNTNNKDRNHYNTSNKSHHHNKNTMKGYLACGWGFGVEANTSPDVIGEILLGVLGPDPFVQPQPR